MDESVTLEKLSKIIGSIYDCAIDPSRWDQTLTEIRNELGFCQATLTLISPHSGDIRLNVTSGIEQIWMKRLPLYGSAIIEQWGGREAVLSHPVGEPILLSEINPTAHDAGAPRDYYLEWREPQGLIDTLNLTLAREQDLLGVVSLGRHARDGAIGKREIDLMRLLTPHLQRAAQISRLLDIKTIAASTFQMTVEALSTAVLIVDREMNLVFENRSARALLDRGTPIKIIDNRLSATTRWVSAAVAVAVKQAIEDESALGRKGLGIPARGAHDEAFILYVLPLNNGPFRASLSHSGVAAIFISSGTTPQPVPGEIVAALFELTHAEARVFELIATGHTTAEAATALGIGLNTLKTHLAHLFEKLNVHRQSEIVALASAFEPPIYASQSTH